MHLVLVYLVFDSDNFFEDSCHCLVLVFIDGFTTTLRTRPGETSHYSNASGLLFEVEVAAGGLRRFIRSSYCGHCKYLSH